MPSEFRQFVLLPPEIRYKIWQYTLPHRVVDMRLKPNIDVRNWVPPGDWWLHYVLDHDDNPDEKSLSTSSLPSVLLTCSEAYHELGRYYRPIALDQALLKRSLGGEASWERDATPAEDYSAARVTRFHRDNDTLRWAGTSSWGLSARSPANPLFLAASLAVRRVVVEYTPAIATQLEVLALACLDAAQPLERLDLVATNPSDGRRVRFRLGETPTRGRVAYLTPGRSVSELVEEYGAAFFPWFHGGCAAGCQDDNNTDGPNPVALKVVDWQFPAAMPLLANSHFHRRGSYCILQVLDSSPDIKDSSTVSNSDNDVAMRVGKLFDPGKLSFQYQHARDSVRFGEDLQMDVLLWIRGMQMHAAGFPSNLPFEIVGLCCHGFCRE